MKTNRGLALIIVAGVLGLLAALAMAFTTLAQLERRASLQRLYATKARLLARSGIEDALARLSAGQDASSAGNAYGGENWDGVLPGQLSFYEAPQEVFKPTGANTAADVETCPVRHAMRPSFFVREAGNPARVAVGGRDRGYSGRLAGDRALRGNTWALKVEDESAKINVNGGFLDAGDRDNAGAGDGIPDHRDPDVQGRNGAPFFMGEDESNPQPGEEWAYPGPDANDPGLGWNRQLVRILDVLGQQPEVGVPNLGTLALQNRPPGGYASIAQLQGVLGATTDLSPYLTIFSWSDLKVICPNGMVNMFFQALSMEKKNRKPLRLEEGGRPPVNLNAASRPVLQALLQDLKGTARHLQGWSTFTQEQTIPSALASAIADEIILRRPFASWQAFFSRLDAMVPGIISVVDVWDLSRSGGGNLAPADLLKANFDPNTDLNKQNADQLMWRWIDKSDLGAWSTEGSLYPTGSFRVAATGRILGPDGRLLAEAGLAVAIEAFSPLRQTTQKDFVGGRTLSDSPRYLSLNTDPEPFHRTTGASAGPAWWGGTPPGQGVAVMTYPCPPTALPGNAADFDGCIGLATIETPPISPSSPAGAALKFLHHFDDGWDADIATAVGRQSSPASSLWVGSSLQPDSAANVWPDSSLPDPQNEPNTLYPDGMHAQPGRCPAYSAADIPKTGTASRGVLQYWVKPVIASPSWNQFHFSIIRHGATGTQALMTGTEESAWGMMAETSAPASNERDPYADTGLERQSVPVRYDGVRGSGLIRRPGLRWHLCSAFWDMNETDRTKDVSFLEKGARTEGRYTYATDYPTWTSGGVQDLTPPGTLMVLGAPNEYSVQQQESLSDSNQVIDELAIYDFTDGASSALTGRDTWFSNCFADGRYYKMDDGSFLSVPLEPDPGTAVRLLGVHWTAYLPSENRQEWLLESAAGSPRQQDPYVTGAGGVCRLRVEAALVDAANPGILIQDLQEGARLNRLLGPFRYRVTFRNDFTATERLDTPILESPFLDDITFLCQPATGPRILSWERP